MKTFLHYDKDEVLCDVIDAEKAPKIPKHVKYQVETDSDLLPVEFEDGKFDSKLVKENKKVK